MSDLRDFFQGASNSIASNVSAPVDGIAWLLRKAGVPVPPNPMGGSDWMAEKGLTQQPQNRTAGLLGEFAGMAGPMVAAAKAPQIAKGLLSLDDKAMDMGRVAIESHMVKNGLIQPATVWHGSPHKFDKFDSSKIGTGEGAQAYGHGLYLAESPDVARAYQSTLSDFGLPDGKDVMGIAKLISAQGIKGEERVRKGYGALKAGTPELEQTIAQAKQAIDNSSSLYKVDLPDEHIAKMLDWDKPLSQQANEVQKALTALKDENGYDALQSLKTGYGANFQGATGQDILRTLERNTAVTNGRPEVASSFLKKQGIPGIRYLDGGSRTAGAGSSNFVVFPGNENRLKILERNGKPIK